MNRNNILFKVWDIAYPLLLYYAVLMAFFTIARMIFGNGSTMYMYCQIFATVLTLPIMYFNFYKNQLKDMYEGKNKKIVFLVTVPVILLLSISLNNILLMSPLQDISAGYKEATDNFYGSILAVEIIGSGILTPILEELVFRGIIYGRLRRMMGVFSSVILSSLLFAMIHLNIVQFPYAFLIGIVLAVFVELSKSVWCSILGHVVANIFAILRTEVRFADFMLDKSIIAWTVSIVMLIIGVIGLIAIWKKEKN